MLSSECAIKTKITIPKSALDNRLSSIYIRPETPQGDPTSTNWQYVTMAVANVATNGQIVITRSRCRMSQSMILTLQSLQLSRVSALHSAKAMPPKLPLTHADRFTFLS